MNKYVVVDIETTGTKPLESDIIEIGAVFIENNQVKKTFNQLIYTPQVITEYITSITGIDNAMLEDAPTIEEVMPAFVAFCEDVPLVGHNVIVFDYRMLKVKATKVGLKFEKEAVDTLILARKFLQDLPSRKLGDLCGYYDITLTNAHRAYDDAYATYELFRKLEDAFYKQCPEAFVPERIEWDMPKLVPITPKQKKYLLNLCEMHKIELEKPIDTYTKSEASKWIDGIIREYGKR
ncbi:MAG: 3'-5' exonuclease [Cellulosilyticaceae bacterium]